MKAICQKSPHLNRLIYVAGFDKVIFTVATTLLTASNGTNSIHAESGVTESIGGSGSTVIKYEVSM